MAIEQVDLRRYRGEDDVKVEEVVKRRDHLMLRGFSAEWVDALSGFRPTLYAPQVVDAHLNGLLDRGFGNPNKMIELVNPRHLGRGHLAGDC